MKNGIKFIVLFGILSLLLFVLKISQQTVRDNTTFSKVLDDTIELINISTETVDKQLSVRADIRSFGNKTRRFPVQCLKIKGHDSGHQFLKGFLSEGIHFINFSEGQKIQYQTIVFIIKSDSTAYNTKAIIENGDAFFIDKECVRITSTPIP